MERTLTCSRYDDTWCDQTDDCLTEWCAGCLLHGVEQERERADAAENAIRGHCALLTGGTTHTPNVADCLSQVHQRYTDLEQQLRDLRVADANREGAFEKLEAENAALREELREVKKDLAEHMRRP